MNEGFRLNIPTFFHISLVKEPSIVLLSVFTFLVIFQQILFCEPRFILFVKHQLQFY